MEKSGRGGFIRDLGREFQGARDIWALQDVKAGTHTAAAATGTCWLGGVEIGARTKFVMEAMGRQSTDEVAVLLERAPPVIASYSRRVEEESVDVAKLCSMLGYDFLVGGRWREA